MNQYFHFFLVRSNRNNKNVGRQFNYTVLHMRSEPHALWSAKFTGMRGRGGALMKAAVFKLMSTCLLAGRRNPAQIAKLRAQRNLRAALQILT